MFGERDRHVLDKISENQYEILKVLRTINDNIIKYCGGEHELKTEILKRKMFDAKFSRNQFEVIKELVEFKTEEAVNNDKNKQISFGQEMLMEKYIQELTEIINELDSRESCCNCLFEHLQGKGWDELCDEGIALFKQLKKTD